jgi:hypothetical protein
MEEASIPSIPPLAEPLVLGLPILDSIESQPDYGGTLNKRKRAAVNYAAQMGKSFSRLFCLFSHDCFQKPT